MKFRALSPSLHPFSVNPVRIQATFLYAYDSLALKPLRSPGLDPVRCESPSQQAERSRAPVPCESAATRPLSSLRLYLSSLEILLLSSRAFSFPWKRKAPRHKRGANISRFNIGCQADSLCSPRERDLHGIGRLFNSQYRWSASQAFPGPHLKMRPTSPRCRPSFATRR